MQNPSHPEWGLVRIDDRLIHGRVIAGWARVKKFSRIQIIDDLVAADPFMVEILRLAAPADMQIAAESFDASLVSLKAIPSPQETMILMKSPFTAVRLYEQGVTFSALNVGGLGMSPGRKKVNQDISISREEYQALKTLHDQGVTITFLTAPGEKPRDFSQIPDNL